MEKGQLDGHDLVGPLQDETPPARTNEVEPAISPQESRTRRRGGRGKRRSAGAIRGAKRAKRKAGEPLRRRRAKGHKYVVQIRDSRRDKVLPQSLADEQVATVQIPKVFSFLEDPATAIRTLEHIRTTAARRTIRHIHIDHRNCEVLGLCASVVMDVLLLQAKRVRARTVPISLSGSFSAKSDAVNVMLKASGIPHHLGLPESQLDAALEERVKRATLHQGSANRRERSPQRNLAAGGLTEYFDLCLRSLGYELKKAGKKYLGDLLTEVIGNAQEHSGGRWYTIGHWHQDRERQSGRCHIVIFNFGTTIYESLVQPEVAPDFRARLESLAQSHDKKLYFKLFGDKWDREALFTLYALQERVSRFTGSPGGLDRGNGSIEVIDFFTKLSGHRRAKMCIVSGHSYILFDGSYALGPVIKGDEELQVIAFNADNDIEKPPDTKNVYRLPANFPGTIVSIELALDDAYLREIVVGPQNVEQKQD